MPLIITKNFKKIITMTLLFVLFGGVASYTAFEMKDMLVGVKLDVQGVRDGETRTDPKLDIHGNANKIVFVSINDRPIALARDGAFNDTLLLLPGYNEIRIKGDDKFGKHLERLYTVFYKEPTANTTALLNPETTTRAPITN
jgi:hypothetical protein